MKKLNLIALCAAGLLAACSGSDDTIDRTTVTLESVTRLEQLPPGAEYQVWLVSGGENISLGRFRNLSNGQQFSALTGQVDNASGIKISIEPGNDPSPEISNTVILSGNFNGNSADLSIEGSLGSFSNASGVFTLWTPTDNNVNNNQNGVWFLRPNGGNPQAGLSLPTLPSGWVYEGWVEVDNASNQTKLLSTGRFARSSGEDMFGGYSSTLNDPPQFPGEDFVELTFLSQIGFNSAPNLTFTKIFISVEPEPDFDRTAPFVMQPLVTNPSSNKLYPEVQNMQLNTLSFPRAVVSRQ
ncbi:anti-sigma factor [Leeuwenhoekiella sp. H156]|uniref:anti-sigma factor n=1 Tax=Leeuwenhoekiella sp. H156 TaxID=3450128 RepID=UPI003FA42E12